MIEKLKEFYRWFVLGTKKNLSNISVASNSGLDENYLFDFKNLTSMYNGGFDTPIINAGVSFESAQDAKYETKVLKMKVKPKDVLNELETMPTPFSLIGIDEKVGILKDKEKLITNYYTKRELVGLIERLENRKKYLEFKTFFDNFANTTDEKIDTLLKKYDLVMKTSDIFIPEFPDEAIKTMTEYTETLNKVCGKKPVFYVIAEDSKFKKAYEKRDPILLVQSPFGFYWQILGAWNEEMILLSEL